MNFEVVSEEQRRANSRAIGQLNNWRRKYRDVVKAIRVAKFRSRWSYGGDHRVELANLRALRAMAFDLMLEREAIGERLRDTAYTYAPRELLAA